MISVKTLNTDNPRLDCRLKGYENFSPIRVILDRNLDIKLNSYLLRSVRSKNTIIFYNSTKYQKLQVLKKKGAILIKTRLTNQKLFNLKDILKTLFLMDIRNLLVEGGDKITKNMINHRLINEFYLFQGSKVLSKSKKHIIFSSFHVIYLNFEIVPKKGSNSSIDSIVSPKKEILQDLSSKCAGKISTMSPLTLKAVSYTHLTLPTKA